MPEIIIVNKNISLADLKKLAEQGFGDMVKAVVDIEKKVMALGGGMHADEEAVLLEQGSAQENLWGINLFPDEDAAKMVEFDSMINIRPRQNNRSRGVEDEATRKKILDIVSQLII